MTQDKYTLQEVNIIMWLKALYDFDDPNFTDDTFDDKMMRFRYMTTGIKTDDLKNVLDKLMDKEIIDLSTEKCLFTVKGKAMMNALGAIKGWSDVNIQAIMNGTVALSKFVKEHFPEIVTIIATH